MAVLLVLDSTRLDFAIAIANAFYDPATGFVGGHSYFLETILHDRVKQAVIVMAVFALVGFVASLLLKRMAGWRRSLGYLVLALALSTAIVTPLKALTEVHCPWDLTAFGGEEVYTPLLSQRAPTDHPGRCWPGGHASSGFALLALFFFLRDRRPRLARAALMGALVLGSVLSLGRMMHGRALSLVQRLDAAVRLDDLPGHLPPGALPPGALPPGSIGATRAGVSKRLRG